MIDDNPIAEGPQGFDLDSPGAALVYRLMAAPNRDFRSVLAKHAILEAGDQGGLTVAAELAAEALEAAVKFYKALERLINSDDFDREMACQIVARYRLLFEGKYQLWLMTEGRGE